MGFLCIFESVYGSCVFLSSHPFFVCFVLFNLFIFLLSYFILSYYCCLHTFCFPRRDRKVVDSDGRGVGRVLEELEEGET